MRYRWIPVLVALAACGDSPTEPPPPPSLNTSIHAETLHSWGNGVTATDVRWRFIELTPDGVRGSYEATWDNSTGQAVSVSYHIRFYDGAALEIDRYPSFLSMSTTVAAGTERSVTGTFTLVDTRSVAVANAVANMEIWASFEFEP
jgi:hypothetical protein